MITSSVHPAPLDPPPVLIDLHNLSLPVARKLMNVVGGTAPGPDLQGNQDVSDWNDLYKALRNAIINTTYTLR